MDDSRDDAILAARRALYREFAVPALAYSLDGATAELTGPLDLGMNVGDIVVVATESAPHPVVQVESLTVVEREPLEVDLDPIDVPGASALAGRGRPVLRSLHGRGSILGILGGERSFIAGTGNPFHETPLRSATIDEQRLARSAVCGDGGPLVGSLVGSSEVPVRLRAEGFSRHTFLCGQSGSGKTYTMGVVLEALRLSTDLPIIVVDPNSDHVGLATPTDDQAVSPVGVEYAALGDEVVVARARGRGGHLDLVAHPSDLSVTMLAALMRLDPVADLDEYDVLSRAVSSLQAPFGLEHLVAAVGDHSDVGGRLARRVANLGLADLGIWCRPGETSVVDSAMLRHRCVIIDTGSLDDPTEHALVAAVLFNTLWRDRHSRRARLVVVDEAHNAFPSSPTDPLAARCSELGALIAGEGRKFGIHLFVATQRPGKVHPNVVSQCDNLVLLRMNSRDDVADLVSTFSHVPHGLLERSPRLARGEVLYAGPISPVPAFARTRRRLSVEGGADLATDWAVRAPRHAAGPASV